MPKRKYLTKKNMETKVCKRCGRELPTTEFTKDKSYPDGLNYICKDCHRKAQRESYERKKTKSILHSEELQKFSPRELIDELKRRGYRGELTFIHKITL